MPTNRNQWLTDIQQDIETGLEQLISSSPGATSVEKTFNAINLSPNKFDIVKFESQEIDSILTEITRWALYNSQNYNLPPDANIVISDTIKSKLDGINLTWTDETPTSTVITEVIKLKNIKNQNDVEVLKVERVRTVNVKTTTVTVPGQSDIVTHEYILASDKVVTTTVTFKTVERKILNPTFTPSALATNVGPKTVAYDVISKSSDTFELFPGEAGKLQRATALLSYVDNAANMLKLKEEMEHPTPIVPVTPPVV